MSQQGRGNGMVSGNVGVHSLLDGEELRPSSGSEDARLEAFWAWKRFGVEKGLDSVASVPAFSRQELSEIVDRISTTVISSDEMCC